MLTQGGRHMKASFVLVLLSLGIHSYADDSRTISSDDASKFEKLGMKNAEVIKMSPEETESAKKQAVQSFYENLSKSDPETQAAIKKTMKKVRRNRRSKSVVRSANSDGTETATSNSN